MLAEDEKERRGIQSIEVGGKILIALTEEGQPMSLKDLAARAQMSPARAHPYLVSLGKLGLVSQDPLSGHYGLGSLALRMGLASLRQLNPVRLGMAAAHALEQRLHLTVALSVWGNAGPTVIYLEESSHPIHMNLHAGTVMALTTATGLVFGAYLPAKMMEQFVVDSMKALTYPHIIGERHSWEDMQPALSEVRQYGLARALGRPIPGVSAFAAPVFDMQGRIVLVVTVVGPTGGFDPDWDSTNARVLKEAAAELSGQLGFSEPRA